MTNYYMTPGGHVYIAARRSFPDDEQALVLSVNDEKGTKAFAKALSRECTGFNDEHWPCIEATVTRLLTPPEVYEHFTNEEVVQGSPLISLCGKIWEPGQEDTTVVGKCPECVTLVEERWTA